MLVLKTWNMAGVSWKMLSILKTPQRAAMKMLLGQLLMEGLEVYIKVFLPILLLSLGSGLILHVLSNTRNQQVCCFKN